MKSREEVIAEMAKNIEANAMESFHEGVMAGLKLAVEICEDHYHMQAAKNLKIEMRKLKP